jgi:hypothetical protein
MTGLDDGGGGNVAVPAPRSDDGPCYLRGNEIKINDAEAPFVVEETGGVVLEVEAIGPWEFGVEKVT